MKRISGYWPEKSALTSAAAWLLCFRSSIGVLGSAQREPAFSQRSGNQGNSLPSLFLSFRPPSSPPFFPSFFLVPRVFASGRHHLSFCQLGDFNLLSFCAITGPRSSRKIVFNCDWLLSGGGRPPPFVLRFLHIPNCGRYIAAESDAQSPRCESENQS